MGVGGKRHAPTRFTPGNDPILIVQASWNVMAHTQKPDFVFRRNGRVHLNRQVGRQFSRLLAAEVCGISGSLLAPELFL